MNRRVTPRSIGRDDEVYYCSTPRTVYDRIVNCRSLGFRYPVAIVDSAPLATILDSPTYSSLHVKEDRRREPS